MGVRYLVLLLFGIVTLNMGTFFQGVPMALAGQVLTVHSLAKDKIKISGFAYCWDFFKGRIVDAARGIEGVKVVTADDELENSALIVTFDPKKIIAREIAKQIRLEYEGDFPDGMQVDKVIFREGFSN